MVLTSIHVYVELIDKFDGGYGYSRGRQFISDRAVWFRARSSPTMSSGAAKLLVTGEAYLRKWEEEGDVMNVEHVRSELVCWTPLSNPSFGLHPHPRHIGSLLSTPTTLNAPPCSELGQLWTLILGRRQTPLLPPLFSVFPPGLLILFSCFHYFSTFFVSWFQFPFSNYFTILTSFKLLTLSPDFIFVQFYFISCDNCIIIWSLIHFYSFNSINWKLTYNN